MRVTKQLITFLMLVSMPIFLANCGDKDEVEEEKTATDNCPADALALEGAAVDGDCPGVVSGAQADDTAPPHLLASSILTAEKATIGTDHV